MEELKVYKDTVTAAEAICDTKAEIPIETEFLIPDYLPQVFKIVKCFVSLVVLQKQVSAARLTVEGYLRIVLFYQAESDETLCQTEQKMPFTKQVELKSGEYFGVDANVSGESEYVNCRAINGRRVDVRGAFALIIKVQAQMGKEIVTGLEGAGIEQKTTIFTGSRLVAVQEKLITAQEPITFEATPEMILNIACSGEVTQTSLTDGKAIVKGIITAHTVYRTGPGHALLHLEKQIPFNEIVEVENAAENGICAALITPTGCTVLSDDVSGASLSVTAMLSVRAYQSVEYPAVFDAFSTQYETEILMVDVVVQELGEAFTQQTEAATSGKIADERAQIVDVMASALSPEIVAEDGKTLLRGRVLLHIFCASALGEIDCYDKACEYRVPVPAEYASTLPEVLSLCAQADVVSVSARHAGDEVSAAAIVRVQGILLHNIVCLTAENVQCTDPIMRKKDDAALRIYYAGAGEDVFSIAKRYQASPAAIAAANDMEAEVLSAKQQLLIPSCM